MYKLILPKDVFYILNNFFIRKITLTNRMDRYNIACNQIIISKDWK